MGRAGHCRGWLWPYVRLATHPQTSAWQKKRGQSAAPRTLLRRTPTSCPPSPLGQVADGEGGSGAKGGEGVIGGSTAAPLVRHARWPQRSGMAATGAISPEPSQARNTSR